MLNNITSSDFLFCILFCTHSRQKFVDIIQFTNNCAGPFECRMKYADSVSRTWCYSYSHTKCQLKNEEAKHVKDTDCIMKSGDDVVSRSHFVTVAWPTPANSRMFCPFSKTSQIIKIKIKHLHRWYNANALDRYCYFSILFTWRLYRIVLWEVHFPNKS